MGFAGRLPSSSVPGEVHLNAFRIFQGSQLSMGFATARQRRGVRALLRRFGLGEVFGLGQPFPIGNPLENCAAAQYSKTLARRRTSHPSLAAQ
jgi:hypothetical protein